MNWRTAAAQPGRQGRVGMQEQQPRRAAGHGAVGKLPAATGFAHQDGGAGLPRDGRRVVARAAVAHRDRQAQAMVAAERVEGRREGSGSVQGRDDDVDVRRHWLQAAPPSTQNLAQCGWLRRHGTDAFGQRVAELELRVVGQQRAGDDGRPLGALALHHHARARRTSRCRATSSRMPQQAVVISGTSTRGVHLRKQHQRRPGRPHRW